MSDEYAHLNLRGWPFSVVPSDQSAEEWVGRAEVRKRLRSLLRTVSRVDASRIVLLWASFGAGKTHALRHLKLLSRDQEGVQALYVVTPRSIKSFIDLHRAIIEAAVSEGLIDELGLALHRRLGPSGGASTLERSLIRLVAFSPRQSEPVLSWLRAEKVGLRELRDVGISSRLETSADAIEILDELIQLLRQETGANLLLMLDEIQELGALDQRRLDEAVGGLHKVFDRNTEGLTLVLSFTTASQQTVARIIGETLYERRSEILTLPAMSPEEGLDFVNGLIEAWSIDPGRSPFPFEPEGIKAVIDQLASEREEMSPRELIRAFDAILREADLEFEDGKITAIDVDFALRALAGAAS